MSLQKAIKLSFNFDRLKGCILSGQYLIGVEFKYTSHFERGDEEFYDYDDYREKNFFGDILIITRYGEIQLEWLLDKNKPDSFYIIKILKADGFDYDEEYMDNLDYYDYQDCLYQKAQEIIELIDDNTKWKKIAISKIRKAIRYKRIQL